MRASNRVDGSQKQIEALPSGRQITTEPSMGSAAAEAGAGVGVDAAEARGAATAPRDRAITVAAKILVILADISHPSLGMEHRHHSGTSYSFRRSAGRHQTTNGQFPAARSRSDHRLPESRSRRGRGGAGRMPPVPRGGVSWPGYSYPNRGSPDRVCYHGGGVRREEPSDPARFRALPTAHRVPGSQLDHHPDSIA